LNLKWNFSGKLRRRGEKSKGGRERKRGSVLNGGQRTLGEYSGGEKKAYWTEEQKKPPPAGVAVRTPLAVLIVNSAREIFR